MEIRRLMNAILRKLWLVAIFCAVGGCLSWYINVFDTTPVYQAETTIYAMNRGKANPNGQGINYNDIIVSRELTQDYTEIIKSGKVTSLAAAELKSLKLSGNELRGMISVNLKKDTSIVGIQAFSTDPETAAAVANAMGKAFTAQISEMTNSDFVGILDEAKVPGAPMPNNDRRDILIGILAGLGAALLVIYVLDLFDNTIRNVEEIEYNLKLRVIGIIPKHGIH